MEILHCLCRCSMVTKGFFPRYKGSMLRGVLGTALRRAVCATRQVQCEACLLASTCLFPRLFLAGRNSDTQSSPLLPPPYYLEPPDEETQEYAEGTIFDFGLGLFADAIPYLPYFIHAITLAGSHGMGQRSEHGAGQFVLERIFCGERSVYCKDTGKLEPCTPAQLVLPEFLPADSGVAHLEVDFVTPCRFKQENRLHAAMPFETLFTLILRRARSLSALTGKAYSLQNYSELAALARQVSVEHSSLCWHDWTRFSGRQQSRMQLGGLVGRVRYQGAVAPFLPLLEVAQQTHIGKQTSFGLGKIRFSYQE